ncbi:hypothetical protein NHX12_028155 [Muraenolepis orangiensis]|uniref:Uncharacterized protein n=1 Tax=Muraenolepis orangiensis TaxID=630683 RepID=A0A9Q0DA97_9TELE|nr:hypothetical protein NHX12_028155 [Muraenolepis orangiensis]
MEKKFSFFPGRINMVFRKGPRGYLYQDPTDEAKLLKENPSLQDKFAPLREDRVKENALTVVRQRGGDVTEPAEVLGEYTLKFGKSKGKSFWWLLQKDVGYTTYLIKHREKEEAAGVSTTEGHYKASLLSFVGYARSFGEIESVSMSRKSPQLKQPQRMTSWLALAIMPRAPGVRCGTTGLMALHPLS